MKTFAALVLSALICTGCAGILGPANNSPQGRGVRFDVFYRALEQEIEAKGLPVEVLRASYGGKPPAPLPEARKAETTQKEFTGTLATYTQRAVSEARVAKGKEMLAKHRATLRRLEKKEGVPAPLIVALWGMESDYGRQQGTMPLLPTLVSMAYKSPRSDMFKRELMAALTLPNAAQIKGSWAGASGHCQFMPSNIIRYGRDGNGDGRVDVWGTEADGLASTAHFVRALGYVPHQPWHWPVAGRLDTKGLSINKRGLSEPLTLAAWQGRGLKGVGVPATTRLRYYKPPEWAEPMMVGPNYEALLGWNTSSFFATSVWMLAERIGEE